MKFTNQQLNTIEEAITYYESKNRESFKRLGAKNDDEVIDYDMEQKALDDIRMKLKDRKEA